MHQYQFFPIYFYYFGEQPLQVYPIAQEQSKEPTNCNYQVKTQSMNINEKEKWTMYLSIFEKQLIKNKEKYEKKSWEPFQDILLVQLRKKSMNWVQISKNIQKTNPQICKRRYIRITQNEKKWPKQLDELIKSLYEEQGKNWNQIQEIILNQDNAEFTNYGLKKIKQRYFLHLKEGIEHRQWEIQEDLRLLTLVKENGKKWKQMTTNFTGRTQLQLKNRYNGTLKLIQKRVIRKLNNFIKNKAKKQDKENKNTNP